MQTLHVISHTHWDREWYLTFQQFRLKLVHLVDKLLDILEEDPDFKHFMLDGQTIVLDDYLQIRPEKEALLRKHIQDRRIQIGPWHVLPDMFLVSPEAHIRNLLEGARTTRKFGPGMPIGYIPDSFGHPGQVPQILKGFGIEAASIERGVSDLPAEIWWESPDGSKVLLAYLRDGYGNGANLPAHDPVQFTQMITSARDSLAAHSAVKDYLIMLGTDHMEPSPHTPAAIAHANKHLPGTQVIHSTMSGYIRSISGQVQNPANPLPTIRGELRACSQFNLLPNVLSARTWIKQRNQYSQTLLEKWAEPFSIFADTLIGEKTSRVKYNQMPAEMIASNRVRDTAPILRHAWRLLMENHPHDSICGCSIDQVYDEMRSRFDQVDQIGEEISLQSLQVISRAVDTRENDTISAITIFNPLGSHRRELVEVDLQIPEEIPAFDLIDENQAVIPYEFLWSSNEEIANVLLKKNSLRDTIGAITEGRVAGAAIVSVKVTRRETTVCIEAILDKQGQPNILEWHRAEEDIARYESDPGVTHFHVLAHTPRSSRIRFISPDVPAFGWRTVWVRARTYPEAAPATEVNPLLKPFLPLAMRLAESELGEKLLEKLGPGEETKPPFRIENEFFLVEASRADGTLAITDRQTGTVFTGLNRFEDGGDAGDLYNYYAPPGDVICKPKVVALKVFRHRLIPSLEITYALRVPDQLSLNRTTRSRKMVEIPIVSRVSLAPGVARVDVRTEIDNRVKDHRLRVHFPAPFPVQAADHDGHFEVVHRPLGVPEREENWVEAPRPEVPQQAFTDISDGKIGLMVANRGLPEVEVLNGENAEIALTLLRCVGWLSRDDLPVRQGHAGPPSETPGGQVPGKWEFDYAIIPHREGWQESFRQALAFQTTLRAVETDIHAGEIPARGAFLSLSPNEFVVSAVKTIENGKGWLVRGYNISSGTIQLRLQLLRRFAQATLVNLAEETLSPLNIGDDGSVSLSVAGHKIISVLFTD